MLEQAVVVSVGGDCTAVTALLAFGVLGHYGINVPTYLLRGRLLPLAALARDCFSRSDTSLHRFELEDAVNSSWIEHELLLRSGVRAFESSNLAWLLWVHIIRLLSDHSN